MISVSLHTIFSAIFVICLAAFHPVYAGLVDRIKSGETIENPTNCNLPSTCLTGDYSVNGFVVAAWTEIPEHDSIEKTFTERSGYVNQHFGAMFEIERLSGVYIFYPSMRAHDIIRSDFANYLHISNRDEFEKRYGPILSQQEFWPKLMGDNYLDASLYAYVQALSAGRWNDFKTAASQKIKAPLVDSDIIPLAIPYFTAVRKKIFENLAKDYVWEKKFIAQDWVANLPRLLAQKKALSRNATLPEILKGLQVSGSFFFKREQAWTAWSIDSPGLDQSPLADYLQEKISRELYALALRANSNGLRVTAKAANAAHTQLTTPLGIDLQLHALLADTAKNSMSPSGLFRMKFNNADNNLTLDRALVLYPLAPIRARLRSNVSKASTKKKYYKTLEYHKPTDSEKAQTSYNRQAEYLLRLQLAEIENRMTAIHTGGSRREDTRAVTGYKCDPGTGLNCRATYQGGGESASSYYSRMNKSRENTNLAAERDRIVQEIAALREAPVAPAYDSVVKSQNVNLQEQTVVIEVQQGTGEWKAKTYSAKAHSIEGRQGVGYGMDKRTLYYHVMSNVASDIVRDLADLAQKTAPTPLPATEKANAEPWDAMIEKCLAGKSGDVSDLLNCAAQAATP